MQFLIEARQKAAEFAQANAATLLTAGGVVGTVATAILAGRTGYKYAQIDLEKKIELVAKEHDETNPEDNPYLRLEPIEVPKREVLLAVAPQFIPPIVVGSATIASIIMGHRVSAAKAAALAAAYGLAERNLSEYKEKVAEKLTGPKKTAIDDDLAQDRVNKTDGYQNIVLIEGEVLCFDEPTARYFKSTMENIKSAVNATNKEIISHEHANATFFYDELGMIGTSWTDEVGWNRDNMLDVKFTTAMSPDGRPCIAIDFKTLPRHDYIPKHY